MQAPPAPPPPAPPTNRPFRPGDNGRLRRSRDQRVFTGVAGGIAEYLGIDVAIVRIAIVVATITTGFPFILYAIAVIVLPKAESEGPIGSGAERVVRHESKKSSLGAVVLISLGLMLMLDRIGLHVQGDYLWPLAFIGIGGAVLWSRNNQPTRSESVSPVSQPPESVEESPSNRFTKLAESPIVQRAYERSVVESAPVSVPTRPRRSAYARSGFAVFVTSVGLGLVGLRVTGVHIAPHRLGAYSLFWLGILLLFGAFFGRPRLLVVGVLISGFLALTSAFHIETRGGTGERLLAPTSLPSVPYRLGIGSMKLDLSNIKLDNNASVKADVGIGELVVTVADDVAVNAIVDAQLGSATVFGEKFDGFVHQKGLRSKGKGSTARTLTLDVGVGLGEVVVQRASATNVQPTGVANR